ncbi:acyl-CoA dehydrogenase [Seongchinamella sediminis]|uniref:Acyl-CoA dehydrogenase n=1 Tax=Seongchinamella sediminis TaxID=2283635 RepID=A0A3L7E5C8_9GAMM|nr:acyl-CoA dehydrogenase [Seongchinamella sediminis]RLQ23792.1 acyl-CoA dehydrogenase [Seongchinamella sediminis]
MALVLNEEQRLLQDSAREFLTNNAPVASLRTLRDTRDALGYDPELWKQMTELGWASIILPEAYGGLEFGFSGLGVVMEESGRTLTASPLFASAVVGASAILLAGNEAQKNALLPAIAVGELTLALALEESHHHRPCQIATTVSAEGDGFVISGAKTFVLDGHSADKLLVVARSSGAEDDSEGLSLLLVDRDAAGVSVQRTLMADSRNAANIRFDQVKVDGSALLGELDKGWQVLEPVLDRGRVALAAELMGLSLEVFDRTVEYLKEREQFGVRIGSFQALQHRAAHIQSRLELCRSVVLQALSAVDEAPEQLPLLASLAKAMLNQLAQLVTNEAVQMHGGIGVTDELDIGFFLKRARVVMQVFGDTGFHKNRYATLCGY